jgi:phosphoribosylformimino-5-aminoimidazole carboxamide ribotide isomerase
MQLGGSIADLDTIERYLDAGLRYVIIGTTAVKTGSGNALHRVWQPHRDGAGRQGRHGEATDSWNKVTNTT